MIQVTTGRLILTVLLATVACSALGETPKPVCQRALERPCVALVLGGGGARGGAHIGVIRALEERQIPVDVVVGTSIGSFVGALYASGKSAADIEQLFAEADWDIGYQDDLPRSQTPNRRKRQMDDFPIQLNLGFDGTSVKLPQGFLQGQGMKNLIDQLLGTHVLFDSFDDLPIAFRAVAADIETGEQVVLDKGDLSTALQISMSLPGIVRPIERDGRLLVDGGIANNLPVSVARELGANIIIAVDIGSPAMTRDQLSSGVSILRQLTSFLTEKNVTQQKALLSEQDIYLKPELGEIDMLSFDKTLEAAESGYRLATGVLSTHSQAQALAGKAQPFAAESFIASDSELHLDRIRLINHSRLSDDYILKRMNLREGAVYTPNDIHRGMQKLYGQGTIARVRTSLSRENDINTLNTLVDEKEWGPGYLDFKLSFEDNLRSQSRYQLGASYRRTNLSPYGAEWYTTAEFGTEKKFNTELYWPIATTDLFWEGGLRYNRNVFSYTEEGESLGEVIENEYGFIGGLGWNLRDKLDTLLGYFYTEGDIRLPVILSEVVGQRDVDYLQHGALLRIDFDSLDDPSFPTRGWKFNTTVTRSQFDLLTVKDMSTQVELNLIGAHSIGRHSLRGQMEYNSTFNDDPFSLVGSFELGGFLHLSGNGSGFISGQHTRFFSLVYTYELAENNYRVLNLPLYLGTSLEAGNAWNDRDAIDYSELIHSASLFLGWDSPIGPAYLAWGKSDTGNHSAYIFMGVTF